MVACWLAGIKDIPERSAEICVTEMFGDAVVPATSAAVGTGLHAFRDPDAREDFEAVRVPLDIAAFHTYAIDWDADRVDFLVDEEVVRTCVGPPSYPMQVMLAVFDFPERAAGGDAPDPPAFVVDHLRVYDN